MNQYSQLEHVVINTLNDKTDLVCAELLVCYMKQGHKNYYIKLTINLNYKNQF